MKKRGLIEASMNAAKPALRFDFPRLKKRGLIEARCKAQPQQAQRAFPRLKKRGLIEAQQQGVDALDGEAFQFVLGL